MQPATRARLIRFTIWALMMFTAFFLSEAFRPHWAIIVPCVFMPFFVPMVLLPLRTKTS
jgi:hypothetical protein